MILRLFLKHISLRTVTFCSLTLIFAALILSAAFVFREFSYDRFYAHTHRMVRFSMSTNGEASDGRIWGNWLDPILAAQPEIEEAVKLGRIHTAVLDEQGSAEVYNDLYYVSPGFFELFDYPLLAGNKDIALEAPGNMVISERMAQRLLGPEYGGERGIRAEDYQHLIGRSMKVSGRKVWTPAEKDFANHVITGVYRNIPSESHFHTDILLREPEQYSDLVYLYLLLKDGTDRGQLSSSLAELIRVFLSEEDPDIKVDVELMPVKDIHLYSHKLREMEHNGEVTYLWLIACSVSFLFLIVLFNVYLHADVIVSANRKLYKLLTLNGASFVSILADEGLLLLATGLGAAGLGMGIAYGVAPLLGVHLKGFMTSPYIWILAGVFMALVMLIGLIPMLLRRGKEWVLDTRFSEAFRGHTSSGMSFLFGLQYFVVIVVMILALGITRQVRMIQTVQLGGGWEDSILVMDEQPVHVTEKFGLFRSELLKNPEIEDVTAAMQLPGSAIRDAAFVLPQEDATPISIPILAVGDGFFPFFDIKPIAGEILPVWPFSYQQEVDHMQSYWQHKGQNMDWKAPDQYMDRYVLNKSALALLGFASAEDAIGKKLRIRHEPVDLFPEGMVCGVVDDFQFGTIFETSAPLLIMNRSLFTNSFMVRMAPGQQAGAIRALQDSWRKIFPDYPLHYTALQDVYTGIYRNEIGAEKLVGLFSLLCLVVANIGLAVFAAFIIGRKQKEIAVRKVNGASSSQVMLMLLWRFCKWMGLAFIFAAPVAGYVLSIWLQKFSVQAGISVLIFLFAAGLTLCAALLTVGWQSFRAAWAQPVEALQQEG